MIWALDAVTTKPSTAGTAELVSAQLSQVAAAHGVRHTAPRLRIAAS